MARLGMGGPVINARGTVVRIDSLLAVTRQGREVFAETGLKMRVGVPVDAELVPRVEIRGLISLGGHWGAYAPRTKKADVIVEVSEDGTAWRKAGELRGISADADFLPVDLGGASVKAIRMTGTVRPYRGNYHPVHVQGDMFWPQETHYNPSFVWRAFAAEKGTVPATP